MIIWRCNINILILPTDGSIVMERQVDLVYNSLIEIENINVRKKKDISSFKIAKDGIYNLINDIKWSDIVYVIKNIGNDLSEEILFEVCYAQEINKKVIFLN